MKGKTSQAEMESRVNEVSQLHLDGYTRSEVIQICSKWKVSDRAIDKYRSLALAKISEITSGTAEEEKTRIVTNLWRLYGRAKINGDSKEEHKLLLSLSKLLGLDKLTITHIGNMARTLKDVPDTALASVLEPNEEE